MIAEFRLDELDLLYRRQYDERGSEITFDRCRGIHPAEDDDRKHMMGREEFEGSTELFQPYFPFEGLGTFCLLTAWILAHCKTVESYVTQRNNAVIQRKRALLDAMCKIFEVRLDFFQLGTGCPQHWIDEAEEVKKELLHLNRAFAPAYQVKEADLLVIKRRILSVRECTETGKYERLLANYYDEQSIDI